MTNQELNTIDQKKFLEEKQIKQNFRRLLYKIYGSKVVDYYLNAESDQILKSKEEIESFQKEYIRLTPIKLTPKDGQNIPLELKGCGKCISHDRFVLQQDFPGWNQPLNKIKYIIIGLEISDAVKEHSHIAYNYYPSFIEHLKAEKNGKNNEDKGIKPITRKLDLFFNDIMEFGYLTDIAKCNCTNINHARNKCMSYLREELILLYELNPDLLIIIQGIGKTWDIIKKEFKGKEIGKPLKSSKFKLLKCGVIQLNSDEPIPTIIFPHSAAQNGQWREIYKIQEDMKNKIQKFIDKHKVSAS